MTGFNLSEWALRNRSLTAYLMIVAVIAGVFSFFSLGRNEDPSFVIKTMVVHAVWPGATVEDTIKQVTERLERTLQETPKLDFLRSSTRAGVTTICSALVTDWLAESCKRTVKSNVPALAGVPVTAPFAARLRPPGSDPPATDHEYGGAPPLADSV